MTWWNTPGEVTRGTRMRRLIGRRLAGFPRVPPSPVRGLNSGGFSSAHGLLGFHRPCVGCEYVGDAEGEFARGRDVEELVRAVRVRARAEDAGDAELGLRELLAEHVHERDRAALAHVHCRLAEVARAR